MIITHVQFTGGSMSKRFSRLIYVPLTFIVLQLGFINCGPPNSMESSSLHLGDEGSNQQKILSHETNPGISPFSTATEKWAKGRILVQPRPGVDDKHLEQILSAHGGRSTSKIEAINVHIVELPEHANEKAIAALLAHNPHLKFAEVDGAIEMQQTTDDPYFGNQWHLSKIGAPAAWDMATGSGITIAILDGGVNGAHPDLASRMVPGWNFYDNNSNTSDTTGHGTKVAGTAAAIGNNTLGVAGAAWSAKIMPMRISDPNGSLTYYSIVANSITWAADHGARVANISFVVSHVATIQSAAQYMQNKGGVVVSSAGNQGVLQSGTNSSTMLTVAATDQNDARASWSNYGPIVDVTAPGVGIYTTTSSGGYAAVNGTSFSSPLTAGVVALMLSANPSLQPSQVESLLKSTAVDLGAVGRDDYYGSGRINAAAAVAAAKNAAMSDTQAPITSISAPLSNSKVSGVITVNANASDNVSVSRVELYVGGVLHATDTGSPYQFSLDTKLKPDGNLSLVTKAFDAQGNVGTSTAVTVIVDNVVDSVPGADTIAPVVTISSPYNGAIVKNTVTISASSTDNVGVVTMKIYIDGVLKTTSNTKMISMSWNTRKISSGAHTVRVEARDAAGNIGYRSIQVTK